MFRGFVKPISHLADAQMCKSRLAAAYTHIESPRSPVGELAVTSMDWCSVDLNSSEHFCCSINQIAQQPLATPEFAPILSTVTHIVTFRQHTPYFGTKP